MPPQDFARVANNFYNSKGLESNNERISLDADLINYFQKNQNLPKYKVAFIFICLNPLYWQYAPEMVQGARNFFLPGHKTDFFFWTDIPKNPFEIRDKIATSWLERGVNFNDKTANQNLQNVATSVENLRNQNDITLFPTESVDWPYPTLLRYNLFLQQEDKLKDYDYIFYCDIDMQFVSIVGDEILGQGITAAPHPGYYIPKELYPPYEPNNKSASYIKRPGRIIEENGKPRFKPEYYAGGFQGGKADKFIEAMKATRNIIDLDLNKGYIPVWNDESAWNKYLSENPPEIMLDPSYIYPDSLIDEYYVPKVWWRNFQPKLKTLTKWFSTSAEGGAAVAKMIK